MGDAAAARVVERFSELVREAGSRHDGKLVKQIGDEFMLAFTDPSDGVRCGLDIDDAVGAEPQFPAVRIGAHLGSVLYREGDYIGTTVNIAARAAATAGPSEFLVTDAVRNAARLPPAVEVVSVGRRALKGIAGEVELHRVVRTRSRAARVVGPVCRMTLARAASSAPSDGVDVICSSARKHAPRGSGATRTSTPLRSTTRCLRNRRRGRASRPVRWCARDHASMPRALAAGSTGWARPRA